MTSEKIQRGDPILETSESPEWDLPIGIPVALQCRITELSRNDKLINPCDFIFIPELASVEQFSLPQMGRQSYDISARYLFL